MKKILIHLIILTALISQNFIDPKPSIITNQDLNTVREFDRLAYTLAEDQKKSTLNVNQIFKYIMQYKAHIAEYSKLAINLVADTGRRTKRNGTTDGDIEIDSIDSNENSDFFPTQYNYYKVGIALKYPLYDEKLSKEINNKKIEYKSKILNIIKDYALSHQQIQTLNQELKFSRLKQIRDKIMQKTAQKYLEDRLKTIESILIKNKQIKELSIKNNTHKLQLINLVQKPYQDGLKAIL